MEYWDSTEALHPVPTPCPGHLFLPALPELYPFITNWESSKENASLSSMNCSSKLIKPKERVVGISSLQSVAQTHR